MQNWRLNFFNVFTTEDNQTKNLSSNMEICVSHPEQDEFSECDENMLCTAADEIEQNYHKKTMENKCSKQYKCLMCSKVYKTKKLQRQHMKTHCVSYKCLPCDKSFTRKADLEKHKKKCGSTIEQSASPQKCKHCGISFPDYTSLFEHVVASHPIRSVVQSGGRNVQSLNHPPAVLNRSDTIQSHSTDERPKMSKNHIKVKHLRKI